MHERMRPAAPINPERLRQLMEELSSFGGGADGSMMRLALSETDGQARDWLCDWMKAQGFQPQIDAIGNQFGLMAVGPQDAPVVMVGSHIDSQPNGGQFDGALGVISACEAIVAVVEQLKREGRQSACHFQLVNWTNEEGARFQPSILGSSVFAGSLELDWALDRVDGDGLSVREALARIGYAGTDKVDIPAALVEIHIEGERVLCDSGDKFGAFTRFWGATKYRIAFIGEQAHTGPTPMHKRKDALLGAAHVITRLREIAHEHEPDLHTSVGRLEVFPNSPNTVPSEVVMFIELRSVEAAILAQAEEKMLTALEMAKTQAVVGYEIRSIDRRKAGKFSPGLIRLAGQTAALYGGKMHHLDTIAGHDAVALSSVCPAIVLVVPSRDGIIHHPSEYTTLQDHAFGTQIMADMLYKMACDGIDAVLDGEKK